MGEDEGWKRQPARQRVWEVRSWGRNGILQDGKDDSLNAKMAQWISFFIEHLNVPGIVLNPGKQRWAKADMLSELTEFILLCGKWQLGNRLLNVQLYSEINSQKGYKDVWEWRAKEPDFESVIAGKLSDLSYKASGLKEQHAHTLWGGREVRSRN